MKSEQELLNKYLEYNENFLGKSKNSVLSYKYDIEKLLAFLELKNVNTYEIEIELANEFILYLSKHKHLSASSINRLISTNRYFYDYLIDENVLKKNIFKDVKHLTSDLKLPNHITYEQVRKIIDYVPNEKFQHRDKLIVALMFYAGLRISEVTTLTYERIFLEDDYMIVLGKNSKQRHVFIVSELKELMLKHISLSNKNNEYLIVNAKKTQITRQSLWVVVKQKAVAIDKPVTPHTLRHSFATHLMEKGLSQYDIKELLGHSSIITSQIYVHVTNKQLKATLNDKINQINENIIVKEGN